MAVERALVTQVPSPAAVTEAKVTDWLVAVLVRVTTTVAPLCAVPEMVGNSLALMMSSLAMLALRVMAVVGAKLLSTVMVVAAL